MEVILSCDWNNHKKDEIVCPDAQHAFELLKLGYATLVPNGIKFKLVEVSIANKESEHLWTLMKESVY